MSVACSISGGDKVGGCQWGGAISHGVVKDSRAGKEERSGEALGLSLEPRMPAGASEQRCARPLGLTRESRDRRLVEVFAPGLNALDGEYRGVAPEQPAGGGPVDMWTPAGNRLCEGVARVVCIGLV